MQNRHKMTSVTQNTEPELKTITVSDYSRFLSNKKYLEETNANYILDYHGTSETIIYNGTALKFVDLKEKAGKGYHISRMVHKDIDAWLSAHGASLLPYGKTYREQLFNINSIEKVVGIQSVAIDINDCYWTTAFLLGYITERTYIMGRRKKEWKEGRNSAIGGLAATHTSVHMQGKKKLKTIVAPPEINLRYTYIRNHIVGHVYNIFYELFRLLGADFYVFMVDCVFTDYKRAKFVKEYLANHGYKTKQKPIEFVAVERGTRKKRISWFDFTAKCKNSGLGKCSSKCGCQSKYYEYADSQVISDGLVEGKFGDQLKNQWIHEKEAQRNDSIKELVKMQILPNSDFITPPKK